jgi:zinc protease
MLDRTKAPEIQEVTTISLPTAEVKQLQNGGRLHIIKSETQPVIRLDFVFKAGKWYESQPGISDLANKMLFEGTVNATAQQIAEKVAYYGASFENNHGYDRSEFTLYCLSKHLQTLLPVVIDVLQNPTFPEKEFEMLKQRNQQNLKVQRQKNSYLATHSFTKLLYGDNHPYIFGFDENALEAIQLNELKNFYLSHLNTKNLEVFACGDISNAVEELITVEAGKLTLGNQTSTPDSENKTPIELREKNKFVPIEDSLQSSIRIGKLFPKIGHSDYHKLVIVSEILGGYFGSRLMRNIREDKGYTYGIYSTISSKETDSMFYIGTDVNYTVTNATVNEIHKEIKLLQNELVPDDELQTVKSYMLGKFLNDITTIFEQCDRYKKIILSQLPLEHYTNYIKTIRSITSNEIKDLANKYLDITDMNTAIAGRKSEN